MGGGEAGEEEKGEGEEEAEEGGGQNLKRLPHRVNRNGNGSGPPESGIFFKCL